MATLKRSISLPLLTLYGLGTTIGAGIFVLIGKIAGVSGVYAPLAFLLASVLAGLSAFSFAELASRFPESAGEAAYVREGFGSSRLAQVIGLCVVAAGIVSTSALVIGFSGYLSEFVPWPAIVSRVGIVILLGLLVCWGTKLSVSFAAAVTLAEVGALVVIIIAGGGQALSSVPPFPAAQPDVAAGIWLGVLSGAVLAFYAFIGFEDIVNVAEETHNPTNLVPRAIVLTLVCTTILYVVVAVIAIKSTPIDQLAASDTPLALIFEQASGYSGKPISAIAVISVLNGALIQIIMASRVLYGMSRRGLLPEWLSWVHPRTRTPVTAIILCSAVIAILTSSFPITELAGTTSIITLSIFAVVNGALVRLKRRQLPVPENSFSVPMIVPFLGLITSVALVAFDLGRRLI